MPARHLTIVAIAALAFASACSKAPKPISSRIVGTWVTDMATSAASAKISAAQGEDAQARLPKAMEDHPPMQMTLTAAGKCIVVLERFEHSRRVNEYEWSLVSDIGDRVTISLRTGPRHAESMEYTFVEPDLIRSEDPVTSGGLLRRVK